MPMSRLLAGTSVMSWPPTTTRPASASSRPASSRSAVVLPQPDGPEQGDQLAGLDAQVEAVERVHGAVAAAQVRRGGRRRRSVGGVVPAGARWVDVSVSSDAADAAAGRRRRTAANSSDEREQQRGERHGDRDRGVALAEQVDRDLEVVAVEQVAMVNSPSTSATDRNAADSTAVRMLGRTTRHITVPQLAPRRAGRLGQRPDVDGATARRRARGRRRAAPGRRTRSTSQTRTPPRK